MADVRRRTWTAADFQHAKRLRAQGILWKHIAERMEVDINILQVQYSKWKHGKLGSRWEKATRIQRMIEMAEAGQKPGAIARHFGVSVQLVCVSLARRGYDGEVRSLYREQPVIRSAA